MYKAILFDLDGTLTESGEGIMKSVQYALERIGKPEADLEKLKVFVGPPLMEMFMKYAHAKDEPVTFQCTQNPDNSHIPQIQILSQGSVQILSVCLNGTECPWHWEEDKVVSDTEADGDQNKIELLAVSQGGKLIKMDPWIFSA